MTKRRKTKEQKIQSGYRLQNFKLTTSDRMEAKDLSEFGYLSREYVVKDLSKTLFYTFVICVLLVLAKYTLV